MYRCRFPAENLHNTTERKANSEMTQLRSSDNPIPDFLGGMETRLSSDDVMQVFSSVKSSD